VLPPRGTEAAAREIEHLYPELPPLPVEPQVLPGPGGKPYTLADFQRIAAANSPTLRQAASDVEAARGALIQAKSYPNPVVQYLQDPSNNNSTAGVQGGAIDQPIITGGKLKLGVAAAQKNLDNAILALKRARNDLATSVRNAYFTLLVDVETLVVTRALVQFSDDIYRLQTGLLKGTQAAPYEPTALRAQTQINRLAYRQAIQSYIYDWKALVATSGLPQLPLSEIAGSVDRFIPYYDYDDVRAHVLQNHTDILTARNGVKIAQYGLKLAHVTGVWPDLDVRWSLEKDFVLAPFGTYHTLALGFPLPLWNRNKGNIIAAQAALVRAGEESHRVEVTLTNNLASAYGNYRNNLYAMEYYRRYILPDLVRYYRGVFERRQIDPSSSFGDLVFAQQNLATNVNTYIGILGSLWTSVVGVADFLQTDDLFQMGKPRELPEVPDFRHMQPPPHWACGHDTLAASCGGGAGLSGALAAAASPDLPSFGPASGGRGEGEAGSPPPPTGAGGLPPPPAQADRPPVRPSAPEGDVTAWLERWRATLMNSAAMMRSVFGEEAYHEG
jgi:cobalt-zinc-cadmium efflux system outer membrane protein